MRINLKNPTNNDTVYATVRLNRKEHAQLNEFMHQSDKTEIRFPQNVTLIKVGFGWYRLVTDSANRNIERIEFAVRLIKSWDRELEKAIKEEIIRLMSLATTNTNTNTNTKQTQTTATVSCWKCGATRPTACECQMLKPATPELLHQLASRFSKVHVSAKHA